MNWLSEKCLVVIGGTSGIGWSAAQAFAAEGARVLALGLEEPTSTNGKSERILVSVGDATREETAVNAIEQCVQHFGAFHGLYHVAGGSGRKYGDGPLHEMTVAGWNKTLELNLTSLMLSNKAALRYFLDQKSGGTILNMASVLGFSPSPNYFVTHAYSAAKASIIGLTQSAASYYASHNIRINALAPSLVETPMAQRAMKDDQIQAFIKTKQPLDGGRVARPADLNGAAIYFMSDHSKFTTGQVLSVDGGWTVSEGQY